MKRFFVISLAVIGGITILTTIISIIVISIVGTFAWKHKEEVSGKTVLEIDLSKDIVEYVPPDDPFAMVMFEDRLNMLDMIEALEKASEDKRVVGLICRISQAKMGFAQIQELRNAVIAFRSKGKRTVAYADTFGEFGIGNGAYYLATAFDEICLQPSGDIGLTGLMLQTGFLKKMLDKLEIVPRMDRRYEYKNAVNTFTEEKYTEAHKEALQKVMESLFSQIVRDVAKARNISEEELRGIIDRGPFLGKEAADAHLVDALVYRDEVYEIIKKKTDKDADFLYLSHYLKRAGRRHIKGDTIALIYGIGAIHRGESEYNPMFGDITMGSDTVAAAFRAAVKDKDVKAILFRIDSPGGSYVASDSVWREVMRAKEAKKPVIVSMGDMAGSGGYFIAMAADKIVAHPGTITGSIGVFAGKMLTAGFWNKIGMSWDEIHTSKNATIWSGINDYTPEQWERLQNALDRIYEDFTDKVAKGRGLSKEKVLEIAKGRIWTGEDAKELGLVDELGGFPTAIRLAKESAHIPKRAEIQIKTFPLKRPIPDILLNREPESSEKNVAAVTLARILQQVQPLIRSVKHLGILNNQDILSMPELEGVEE